MPAPKCFTPYPAGFLDPIDVPEGESGDFRVKRIAYPAGHVFHTAPMRSAMLGGQEDHQITYPTETKWHHLQESRAGKRSRDGWGTWMSTLPCEQMQMMDGIRTMKGHVLVGGLGLGLVVNMLCARPRVSKVTVIERSKDVVNLVEPYLRRNGKDVIVLCDDVFDYLKTPAAKYDSIKMRKRRYDSAFFDTWAGDGIATFYSDVIPLLYRCSDIGVMNVSCWQENVMRGQLFLGVLAQLSMIAEKIGEPDPTDVWGYAARLARARQLREGRSAEEAAKLIAAEFGTPGFERDYGVKSSEMKTWLALVEKLR